MGASSGSGGRARAGLRRRGWGEGAGSVGRLGGCRARIEGGEHRGPREAESRGRWMVDVARTSLNASR